jgi:GAF domain-containing protein
MLERALHRGTDVKSALQGWLGDVSRVADAQRASLMLLSTDQRELHIAASVGLGADVVASTRVPVGHRMAGFVAHTGRAMLVRRRGMPAIARLYKNQPDLTSALLLPLRHDGRVVGVLNLARGADHISFTTADQEWLQRLAQQVSPVLARRYRYVPTQKPVPAEAEAWNSMRPNLAANAFTQDVAVQ